MRKLHLGASALLGVACPVTILAAGALIWNGITSNRAILRDNNTIAKENHKLSRENHDLLLRICAITHCKTH